MYEDGTPEKSVGVSLLLTAIFSPLGLFYTAKGLGWIMSAIYIIWCLIFILAPWAEQAQALSLLGVNPPLSEELSDRWWTCHMLSTGMFMAMGAFFTLDHNKLLVENKLALAEGKIVELESEIDDRDKELELHRDAERAAEVVRLVEERPKAEKED